MTGAGIWYNDSPETHAKDPFTVPEKSDIEARKQIAARVEYYREMGIYDFYRQPVAAVSTEAPPLSAATGLEEPMQDAPVASSPEEILFSDPAMPIIKNKAAAMKAIRADIGDCKRCRLHEGRTNIVFGVGNLDADLMFVGEGPGADEDEQGEPFVGRAGQLLNNMISAMGLRREDVYIANVVKCRPPGNRAPEQDESDTCSPFLMRQIEVVHPKVIVALGLTAAKNLLLVNDSLGRMRGRWYDFRGARLAVTYHPAYLLRDPRQKKETWLDLQMVMTFLGLKPSPKQTAP